MDQTLADKLLRALSHAHNTYTLEDVLAEIESGRAQVWLQGDSLLVTLLEDYPQERSLRVWLAAGDISEIAEIADRADLYDYATANNIDSVVIWGRRGWRPFLDARGFIPSGMVEYRKEM